MSARYWRGPVCGSGRRRHSAVSTCQPRPCHAALQQRGARLVHDDMGPDRRQGTAPCSDGRGSETRMTTRSVPARGDEVAIAVRYGSACGCPRQPEWRSAPYSSGRRFCPRPLPYGSRCRARSSIAFVSRGQSAVVDPAILSRSSGSVARLAGGCLTQAQSPVRRGLLLRPGTGERLESDENSAADLTC